MIAGPNPAAMPWQGRSLWSNAAIMGLGQIVYILCQLGMLVAVARAGGPEMLGRFALALAITAPVMMFSNLALRPALVTDVGGEHPLGRYLALRFATTMIGGALVLGIALCLRLESELTIVVMAVALAKALESLSDILYGIAQRNERFDLIARSMSARGVLGLLGMAAGIGLTGQVIYGVLALTLAWALVLVFHDWPMTAAARRASAGAGPPRSWLGLAWSVLPLGFAVLLISLNGNLPRYVIAHWFGEADLGVFAAMAYLVLAGGMLINVLGQVAVPRLARAAARRDRRAFVKLMAALSSLALGLGLVGVLSAAIFHGEIMTTLYGRQFTAHSEWLVWVMVAGLIGFITSGFGFGATALRMFRIMPLVHGAACVFNLIACLVLAPLYGPPGVILAWAGSLALNLALALAVNVAGLARPILRERARASAPRPGLITWFWEGRRCGLANPRRAS
jgi:O-antigen/teichoic acid export membrane protein